MKLRIFLLALIMLFTILHSGCWDYEEYEDMVQVSAMGVDYNKESHDITLSIQHIPTVKIGQSGGAGSTGSTSPNKESVYTASGKTIYDALSKVQQVIYKKLFYGYLKVIVIGKDAAQYKMMDLMELFDRTSAIRNTSYIAITSGKAEDTISTFDASQRAPSSEEIYEMINLANKSGVAYSVSVQDLASNIAIPGIEATAPRVITVSNIPKPSPEGGKEKDVKFAEGRPGNHRVEGVAAFKGDKFVGWLNDQESLGFGFITGKNILAYKVSLNEKDTEDTLFYRLSSSKGKIKVRIDNGKPIFQVDVKVIGDLRKYYSHKGSDYLGPKVVNLAEKKLSDSIRSDIEAALKRGQKELKTDIFGFGFALFREDPKLWRANYDKKWYTLFPSITITANVKAKIINTGTNIRRLYLR